MRLVKTSLAIGIAIIFAIFIAYGLHVIYEPPKYQPYETTNHCYDQYSDCLGQTPGARGGAKEMACKEERDRCIEAINKQSPKYTHARNSFFILVTIGIAAIILGIFLSRLEGIGSGLIGGGILTTLWSLIYTWQYWFTLNKYIKLAALGIVLAILIFLGYRKIEKRIK